MSDYSNPQESIICRALYMTCKRRVSSQDLFGLPFWVHDLGHCRSEVTRLEDTRRASAYTVKCICSFHLNHHYSLLIFSNHGCFIRFGWKGLCISSC